MKVNTNQNFNMFLSHLYGLCFRDFGKFIFPPTFSKSKPESYLVGPPGNIGLKCCSLVKKTGKLLKSRSDICFIHVIQKCVVSGGLWVSFRRFQIGLVLTSCELPAKCRHGDLQFFLLPFHVGRAECYAAFTVFS